MRTLVLLLRAGPPGVAALDDAAAAELDRLRGRVPGIVRWQRAGRLATIGDDSTPWGTDDPGYAHVTRDGLSNGVHLGGFDVAIDLSVDGTGVAAIAAAVAGATDRFGDTVDPGASLAILGDDHSLLEGHGTVQLFYAMRRLPGVTHEEFSRFWVQQHSQIGRITPGLAGYHQLHADPEATSEVAGAAGFGVADVDGVALEWFLDMADFLQAVGSPPSFANAAKSSETQFNDLDRAVAIVAEVLEGSDHDSDRA